MSHKGWIRIHRKIQEHWLWQEKPFDKKSAWIDLLLMANHEDKTILLGNELIEVKRGSRVTSLRQLCNRWGWSNTKVKNFLNLLEKENMIAIKSDSKKTTITIVNYNDYQKWNDTENDTETTEKRHENDTKTTQEHTNNNDNNDKNDKNEKEDINNTMSQQSSDDDKPTDIKFDEDSVEIQLARFMISEMLRVKPDSKVPKDDVKSLQSWAKHIDYMIRLDKRTPRQIAELFRWAQNDTFWCANIRSPQKLRKQWDTLELQRSRSKRSPNKNLSKLEQMYREALEEEGTKNEKERGY